MLAKTLHSANHSKTKVQRPKSVLPARFNDAWDLPLQRQFAEADTTQVKLA